MGTCYISCVTYVAAKVVGTSYVSCWNGLVSCGNELDMSWEQVSENHLVVCGNELRMSWERFSKSWERFTYVTATSYIRRGNQLVSCGSELCMSWELQVGENYL